MSYFIMLFMFDEDYYYSGGFKICYSEINHIEVEDEVYTSKALVVVCKLMKDEKVIGYDRMVAQDFICLKAKIDEVSLGAETAAPQSGRNTQAVQLVDLDEDGTLEAVAAVYPCAWLAAAVCLTVCWRRYAVKPIKK